MPINLNQPLAWKEAGPDELGQLQSLQGNILKGHGRDFTVNLFFCFGDGKSPESRRLLRELANFHIVNAHQQLLLAERFNQGAGSAGPFVHLALSAEGYRALGLGIPESADPAFMAGMKNDAALGDPPFADWEAPFQLSLHGVLIAAHDTAAQTAALANILQELVLEAGASVVFVQSGQGLKNAANVGIEHFGYVDGRSQPLVLTEDVARESSAAGESQWRAQASLDIALVPDPWLPASLPPSFGSYLVFRKLEQDVRGFKTREQELADALHLTGEDRELAGALVVGRFEDGTPVTLSKEARGLVPQNNFNYDADPGQRCPFHAHIRKSNPRGSGGGEPAERERLHLMIRRGIPYEDVKRSVHPDQLPAAETLDEFKQRVAPLLPSGGVGLLFMAYNCDIGRQFQFTQRNWVNNPGFPLAPVATHGIDPVIGQGSAAAGAQKVLSVWDDPTSAPISSVQFSGFVQMRGGEYFFSPSLKFLRGL